MSVGAALKGLGMKLEAAVRDGNLEEQAVLVKQANEMVLPLVHKLNIDTSAVDNFKLFEHNCAQV